MDLDALALSDADDLMEIGLPARGGGGGGRRGWGRGPTPTRARKRTGHILSVYALVLCGESLQGRDAQL
jgi:hypothetical protein